MTTWNLSGTKHHMFICNGGSCMKQQGEEVTQAIREEIKLRSADSLIHTTRTKCNGRCENACVVMIYPQGVWYQNVTPELAKRIVSEHVLGGRPQEEHLLYTYRNELVPAHEKAAEGKQK
ncbi:(2Fe-2S) ferredoxin domain-containing protein [Brevibacillus invocatus]|uniref:(2Fe-2S) ferredoxin domain-containing protein n=1 Tax=Brevibacillus invocatus TaxID=173959 RepID=A0A3M8BXT6_9BACL|nr:(2Fe-2S) ferredoxin domain-containing protein [Brevibacillus invocatus]RNB68149.1 (2Fe-2S) ferredoxin domain-containing protein [Brevibacillus invocatus]